MSLIAAGLAISELNVTLQVNKPGGAHMIIAYFAIAALGIALAAAVSAVSGLSWLATVGIAYASGTGLVLLAAVWAGMRSGADRSARTRSNAVPAGVVWC